MAISRARKQQLVEQFRNRHTQEVVIAWRMGDLTDEEFEFLRQIKEGVRLRRDVERALGDQAERAAATAAEATDPNQIATLNVTRDETGQPTVEIQVAPTSDGTVPGDPTAAITQALEGAFAGGEQEDPLADMLGGPFPEGFRARQPGQVNVSINHLERFTEFARQDQDRQLTPEQVASRAPRYTDRSVLSEWHSLAPAERLNVQTMLEAAGLLQKGYTPGALDTLTKQGIRAAMGFANDNGMTWRGAVDAIAATNPSPAGGRTRTPFSAPAYLPPDYATLKDEVIRFAEQRLQRRGGLKDYEIALLADEMAKDHRRAYEARVAQQRATHEATQDALESDTETSGGEVGADVDPAARFRNRFREMFKGEMAAEEAEDDSLQTAGLLFRSLTLGDDVMGAG